MAATIKPSFHHVTLKTTRLPQMVEWYKTLVGIEVLYPDSLRIRVPSCGRA